MNFSNADMAAATKELFSTDALRYRHERMPDVDAELAAHLELATLAVDDARQTLRHFLEVAMKLCGAGTAGVSVAHSNHKGEPFIQWTAVRGALAAYEGETLARNTSICGPCLDAMTPLLALSPERALAHFRKFQPAMVECLVVPVYGGVRQAVGTLWVVHHDGSRFCLGDAHILQRLSIELTLVLKLAQEATERRSALSLLESSEVAQQKLSEELALERQRCELAVAEESRLRAQLIFKEAVVREVDHRAKNTLQTVANLLKLQSRATRSSEAREAISAAYRRLLMLATLHERLHLNSGGERALRISELLELVTAALRESFAELADRVRLNVATDEIVLPQQDAVSLALLANELITNAYKHAFPNGARGEINVDCRIGAQGAIVLQVLDNGVGCDAITNTEGNGLGHALVRSFAKHLNGVLDVSRPSEGGVAVTLTLDRRGKRGAPKCAAAPPKTWRPSEVQDENESGAHH